MTFVTHFIGNRFTILNQQITQNLFLSFGATPPSGPGPPHSRSF